MRLFDLHQPYPTLDRWARYLLVAMIFSVPLSTAATNLLKFSLLLCWIAAGGFLARWQVLRRHPLAWAAIGLYGVVVLSSLWSPAPLEAAMFQWSKYSKILMVLPAITLLQESRWRERAIDSFLLAMGLTLAASYLHVFWAFPGAQATQQGASDNHFVFKNHIEQNIMMSFLVLVALFRSMYAASTRARVAWAGVAAAAIVNIVFFVNGRTGHLTLAAVVALAIFMAVPRGKRLLAVATTVVLAGALAMTSSNLQHRWLTVENEVEQRDVNGLNTSSGQRMEFWLKSVDLIREKPMLGWGTGAYGRAFCGVASSEQWCRVGAESHPHNQTLYLGVESGALGIAALWLLQLLPLWMARAYPLRERVPIVGLTLILWIDGLFNVPFYAFTEAFFFTMMLAALLADYSSRLQQSGDAPDQTAQMAWRRNQQPQG